MQAMENWVGPGNKARSVLLFGLCYAEAEE